MSIIITSAGGRTLNKNSLQAKEYLYICNIMILVTGGTGLVGSHLLWHLLQAGEKVRAIHRSGSDLEQVKEVFGFYNNAFAESNGALQNNPAVKPGKSRSPDSREESGPAGRDKLFDQIEWFEADILDPVMLTEAFEGITSVYHCAAIVSFDPSRRKQLIKTNVDSTAGIVNLCLEHNVKKLCHVSSVSAVGSRYDGEPVVEDDLWRHSKRRTGYSISKFYSEMEVWRGISEGLNAVIVNPSVILGPGNWHRGSSGFFTTIQKGMKYYTAGMTGFIDVRDVCRCMINLMRSDISGERFILNGADLWYRDLFNMIADALGTPRPSIHASKWMVELGWRLEWLRSKLTFSKPALTKETARSGRGISRFSNRKVSEALQHEFIPIEETIRWTAAMMKKSG